MKNGYTIDHANKTITLTKAYAKMAYTPGTDEFRELSAILNAYPYLTVAMRKANPKKNKEKHNGLTVERMTFIVKEFVKDKAAIAEFENVKKFYKGVDGYYGKVKGWFLNKYPKYQELVNSTTDEGKEPDVQAPASEEIAA